MNIEKYKTTVTKLSDVAGAMIDAYEQAARDAKSESVQRSLADRKQLVVEFLNSALNGVDAEYWDSTLPDYSGVFGPTATGEPIDVETTLASMTPEEEEQEQEQEQEAQE